MMNCVIYAMTFQLVQPRQYYAEKKVYNIFLLNTIHILKISRVGV
jgi:hypothetical protein